jgi:hypothetical protein
MAANYLTQQDVNEYGNEVLDMAQRAALHAIAPELQRLADQNAEMRGRLARETQRNLFQTLDRAVPDWRRINDDPQWIAWLHGRHELSGLPRQRWLDDAVAQGDAGRVIEIFRGYLQTAAGHRGQERARQTAAGPPQATVTGRHVYSRPEIAKLYAAHQAGAYQGREADWARQEQDIIAAGREGRVIGAKDVAGR